MSNDENLTPTENLTVETDIEDIKVVDYLTDDDYPEGIPKKIKNSPNCAFYYDALRAGWSLRQLQRYAKNHFDENISTDTFRRLANIIPKTQIIPQLIRDVTLKGIDAKIDCLQELQNAIELQKYRVSIARAYEERTRDTAVIPIFMKPVREEVQLLWTMLKELTNLQTNLGLLKSKNNIPRFTGISKEQGEATAFVDTLSTESQRKLLTVIEEIDDERTGPKINVSEAITVIDKHCSNKVGNDNET